ncbi:hypothetical protein WR25_00696 [Diploscapter pachys]|uniref:Uncharacterized protein n=1 Tax=Diploscapter pachys TaxID=2018661 RepID=A0A2A2LUJ6_9BILA|nr:hypothetical protein WR25_00696 [Diploscapter pachys]
MDTKTQKMQAQTVTNRIRIERNTKRHDMTHAILDLIETVKLTMRSNAGQGPRGSENESFILAKQRKEGKDCQAKGCPQMSTLSMAREESPNEDERRWMDLGSRFEE